jgi:bacterioferritin-associated ferredoxin
MIVCSCNRLTDRDVRGCCNGPDAPRQVFQVYRCLGCSPRCGRCARTIDAIMKDAYSAAASCACPEACHCAAAELDAA